jgi:hypothetical protein
MAYFKILPQGFEETEEKLEIVTRLGVGRLGFDSRQGQGFFSLRHRCVKTGFGNDQVSHPLSRHKAAGS